MQTKEINQTFAMSILLHRTSQCLWRISPQRRFPPLCGRSYPHPPFSRGTPVSRRPKFRPFRTAHGRHHQYLLHMLILIMDILKVSIQITTTSLPTDHYDTVRFNGVKYLTHRITYQSYHHDILPASSRNEISHTLYLGSITSREVYQILKG